MKNNFIIDRIEGDFIVAEDYDGTIVNIPSNKLIGKFKEGDVLVKDDQFFRVDNALTEKRRKEIADIMKDMWQ